MPTKKTSFVCDYCNRTFNTSEKAQACEDTHLKVTEYEVSYTYKDKEPTMVTLTLEDGSIVDFERETGWERR